MENSNTTPIQDLEHATLIRLSPDDNVLIAIRNLAAGTEINIDGTKHILTTTVGLGHKIAAQPIEAQEKIIKCHVSIGSAKRPIQQGEHIHLHNMKSDYLPTYDRGDKRDTNQEDQIS